MSYSQNLRCNIKKTPRLDVFFLYEHLAIGKATLVDADSDTELVPRPQAEWKLSVKHFDQPRPLG